MQKKVIHLISAARPNYMKIAPLYHALQNQNWAETKLIHTGQHYDFNMFRQFFNDLNLPEPHVCLNVGKGSHAEQTASVMIAYEKLLETQRPDLVIVAGDVNSTMAVALTAAKKGIRSAHLEAGLRSSDKSMPEEINRIVTDRVCDFHWASCEDAVNNLLNEGITGSVQLVGNAMIDSLEMYKHKILSRNFFESLPLGKEPFGIVTLHRPSNVDNFVTLKSIVSSLVKIARKYPLFFPAHPRTRQRLTECGLFNMLKDSKEVILSEPAGYLDFMNVLIRSAFAISDSGGIQEETTYLGIPCFTLRSNTERPVTITLGTNQLCHCSTLKTTVETTLASRQPTVEIPFWDGKTSWRIVRHLRKIFDIPEDNHANKGTHN